MRRGRGQTDDQTWPARGHKHKTTTFLVHMHTESRASSIASCKMFKLYNENFQGVQLQEFCSASKTRLSISLSAHKGLSTALKRVNLNLKPALPSLHLRVICSALPDPDALPQRPSSHLLSGRRAGSQSILFLIITS